MKRALVVTAVLIALSRPIPVPAQKAPTRIPTTTRLVVQFTDLETQLLTAVRNKDGAALDRFLADDFEVWTPSSAGAPVPREDWVAEAIRSSPQSFGLRNMAVRTFESLAVVSFQEMPAAPAGPRERPSALFVVDVWQKAGDAWQLRVRYQAPAPSVTLPTHPRPSGKE